MTGVLQVLEDAKTIISTDKRIWLAVGFLFTCGAVYLVTGSWREIYVEEAPVEWKRVRIPNTVFRDRILKLNRDVEESKKEQAELQVLLTRASNNIKSSTKEIDWQVDKLIDTLELMSNKVDGMVSEIGPQLIQQKGLEGVTGGKPKRKR